MSKTTIREYFEANPNATIRKFAKASNLSYNVLLTKKSLPIPGTVYDPEATNWDAIQAYVEAKKVDYENLDWAAMNEVATRKGSTLIKDPDAFKVGDKVYLRKNNETPYEILYKTETHIVIMLEGTSEPLAWAINTFMINGPVFEPRTAKSPNEEVAEEA